MNYTVSVINNTQLIYLPLPEGKSVEISTSEGADVVIPEFGRVVSVTVENRTVLVHDRGENGSEETVSLRLNNPHLLDDTRRIAVCVSEENRCESIAFLDDSFSILLGRTPKRKIDGRENNIILPLPFVSNAQFEIVRKDGKTTLTDPSSPNGTFVNGKLVHETELQSGDVISILTVKILYERDYLRFENTGTEPEISEDLRLSRQPEGMETELFKRSPRIQERLPGGKIEIPAPPAKANKPEINWLSTLLPAGVTVAIAVTMAVAFQNTMMMLYSLPMTVAGVIVSIVNYLRGNKTYRQSSEERRSAYQQKLDDVAAEINAMRESQKKAMLLADPSPNDCLTAVRSRSTALWCREPNDPDFVSVRLGTGVVPFAVALDRPREQLMEEDELGKKPAELYRASCMIEGMPVLCDIRSNGVIGLLGERVLTQMQLQNMIFHLTTHHCRSELKLVCFYS